MNNKNIKKLQINILPTNIGSFKDLENNLFIFTRKHLKNIIIALSLLGSSGNILAQAESEEIPLYYYFTTYEECFNHAIALQKANNPKEAIFYLEKSIDYNPKHGDSYFLCGTLHLELKEYGQAIDKLNTAIKLRSNLYQSYVNRSMAKFQLNDFAGSISDCTIALGLPKANRSFLYELRGAAELGRGNPAKALADLNKAISISPSASAMYNRGTSKLYLKDTRGACEDWRQSVELGHETAQGTINYYCK